MKPVGAWWNPHDGWQSTGISFDDYFTMNTVGDGTVKQRRLEPPAWSFNAPDLREVLVLYLETRARISNHNKKSNTLIITAPAEMTLRQRLDRAEATLKNHCAQFLDAELNRNLRLYAAIKKEDPNHPRLERLAETIENADTQLRTNNGGGGLLLRVVHLYHSCGLNSPDVAAETGLKPPHVRMILLRLAETWRIIEGVRKGEIKIVHHPHLLPNSFFDAEGNIIRKQWQCAFCGIFFSHQVGGGGHIGGTQPPHPVPGPHLPALHFCNPDHKKLFKAGKQWQAEQLPGFGIPVEQALAEAVSENYQSYVRFCGQQGINPMPEHVWSAVK